PSPRPTPSRHVYVFSIDSNGRSYLIFPHEGSVENIFPLPNTSPALIPLGRPGSFRVMRPYGVDTFYLLTTDEALPNPSILEWEPVRGDAPQVETPLEQLLLLTNSGERSRSITTPATWSLEKIAFESVYPRKK
ncbi:MAG TPA: hypothetical protein VMU84_09135, partial [Thermoanaerobaculia bacterium]|nr:hypothetical protein [Thermoanaerobaculia bacterium]